MIAALIHLYDLFVALFMFCCADSSSFFTQCSDVFSFVFVFSQAFLMDDSPFLFCFRPCCALLCISTLGFWPRENKFSTSQSILYARLGREKALSAQSLDQGSLGRLSTFLARTSLVYLHARHRGVLSPFR